MKFTFRTYKVNGTEPVLEPVTVGLPSVAKAQELARRLSSHENMASAEIELIYEDGTKERWHREVRLWNPKDA
jgi:hypothetical protein